MMKNDLLKMTYELVFNVKNGNRTYNNELQKKKSNVHELLLFVVGEIHEKKLISSLNWAGRNKKKTMKNENNENRIDH